jgi:hypothetical protein
MSSKVTNIVCLKHPQYDGIESPELACKTCCSKFVGQIRSQQNESFKALTSSNETYVKNDFTQLKFSQITNEQRSKRTTNFDGSWI